MCVRYLAAVLVTSLCLPPPLAGGAAGRHCGVDLRARYSARALHRMRTELQLRLLEARRNQLRLAYDVLAHRGPPDALLRLPDDAAILSQGAADARLKHLSLEDATTCW